MPPYDPQTYYGDTSPLPMSSSPVAKSATRPLLRMPRPRKRPYEEVSEPSEETVVRTKWLEWVRDRIAATTDEKDPWNDERWEDWSRHGISEELSFEAWRRQEHGAKL